MADLANYGAQPEAWGCESLVDEQLGDCTSQYIYICIYIYTCIYIYSHGGRTIIREKGMLIILMMLCFCPQGVGVVFFFPVVSWLRKNQMF